MFAALHKSNATIHKTNATIYKANATIYKTNGLKLTIWLLWGGRGGGLSYMVIYYIYCIYIITDTKWSFNIFKPSLKGLLSDSQTKPLGATVVVCLTCLIETALCKT